MNPLSPLLKVVRCSPANPETALSPAMGTVKEGAKEPPLAEYVRTRDESLLAFADGATPTWFHLRRLPLAWMTDVLDVVYPRSAQRVLAFRASCHLVAGPGAGDGAALTVESPGGKGPFVATQGAHGVTLAPSEWAQEVADLFDADVVQEMGELAITHSRLRRGARGPFGWWGGSVANP